MKILKWVLIVVFLVLFGGGIYWYVNSQKKKVDLNQNDYSIDEKLRLEVGGRTWTFEQSTQQNIITSLTGEGDIVTYTGGTFPLTKIVEKRSSKDKPTKFDTTERATNKKLLANLVAKYGTFVTEAAQRFSIPELYIYIVMAVENTDGLVNSGQYGTYVGLVQISSGSFADTLATQKKRRLLTKSDIQFFSDKLGSSSLVTNKKLTDAELNINAGALHLSEMIVDNKFDVVKDIHKIIFSYNRGKNRLDNDRTKSLGIDEMINHYLPTSHSIGAEYIIRALGPSGAADILVNDLGIKA